MTNAYDLLGVEPNATRAELDAAYLARQMAYEPARVVALGEEFVQLATRRRAELAAAYTSLRPTVSAPLRLEPAAERRRDWQTIWALLLLLAIGVLAPLLKDIAVPQRTITVKGAEAAVLAAQAAPDFTLEALDGSRLRLADLKGKVVLINFWATWCPSCVREMPRLARVYERYKDQGFVLLGIDTAFQDDRSNVETFVRDQGITYPILLDTDAEVSQLYPSRLIPSTYLIDRAGKVVAVRVGEVDEAQLQEQVAALLRGAHTAP